MEDNQELDAKALREDYQILKDCINGIYQEDREILQELMVSSQPLAFWSALSLFFFFGELDLNLSKVGTEQMGTMLFQGIQITGLTKQKLFSFFFVMIVYSSVRFIAPFYKLVTYQRDLYRKQGQRVYYNELFNRLEKIEEMAVERGDIIGLDVRLQLIRGGLAAGVSDMIFKAGAPVLLAALALRVFTTTGVPPILFTVAALVIGLPFLIIIVKSLLPLTASLRRRND